MASVIGKIYICAACGAQVIVTKAGNGTLRCCGAEMQQKSDLVIGGCPVPRDRV